MLPAPVLPSEFRESVAPPGEAPPARRGLVVLHLEDDRIHAETVRKLIATDFPRSVHTVVKNRPGFLAALQARRFDLVVSDFSLEAFNGLEALTLAREHAPQSPFLFYSGTIGPGRAAQALRQGAADYVPKGQLQELRTAIRRIADPPLIWPDARGSSEVERRFEGEAQRIRRLESLALLTAGAAHDLNNVLSPILMAAPLMRESMPLAGDRRFLETLERNAQRAAKLVRQVLVMAQQHGGERGLVRVEHVLAEIVEFMLETFSRRIAIEVNVASGLWPVKVVAAQIYQAVLNLCVNARTAMPQGGRLVVTAENCSLRDGSDAWVGNARAGSFVAIGVEDTGAGFTPEALGRVWWTEPSAEEGGAVATASLPTVHGIIRQHGGFVHAMSAPGLGSSFRIYLPASV